MRQDKQKTLSIETIETAEDIAANENLTMVNMKITAVCVVTPYSLVDNYLLM